MRRLAIVGATGAVGQEFLAILRQRGLAGAEVKLLASARSAGRKVEGVAGPARVEALTSDSFTGVDLAFFSAGSAVSREFVPVARRAGALVIDNSSAFRLDPDVPLVIPEVNPQALQAQQGLIANPNCSAIILALVLWPLHCRWRARRVVVSTYQAVSGAGARALAELDEQTRDALEGRPLRPRVFPVPCAFNVFSHDSPVGPDGYNGEEAKIIAETRKIFGDRELLIAPTCIRVPVRRAHTETLAIEFERPVTPQQARAVLAAAPGVRVVDDPQRQRFPTPLEATGGDEVLVGRLRQDPSVAGDRGLQLMCCGDQLRKGAALNAIEIAELLQAIR